MVLELPAVGSRGLNSPEDLECYLEAFNRDDFAEYTRYYHKDFKVSAPFSKGIPKVVGTASGLKKRKSISALTNTYGI